MEAKDGALTADEIKDSIYAHAMNAALNNEKPEPFYLSMEDMIEFKQSTYALQSFNCQTNQFRFYGVPLLLKPPVLSR